MSRVINRVHFIVRLLPDISPLLSRTQNRLLLLQFAARRGWPSNGTWRAHCGKYYRIFTAWFNAAIMVRQSHPGAYLALIACQNS